MAVINVTVANLRREPRDLTKKNFDHDDERETQLLLNEKIEIISEQNNWVKIKAVEQPRYVKEKGWQHYEGWVHEREILRIDTTANPTHVVAVPFFASLSYGTFLHINAKQEIEFPNGKKISEFAEDALRPLNTSFDRHQLVNDAIKFINFPYLWGGRAAYFEDLQASVDCSGLINLIYRGQGCLIPRDACDQFRHSIAIEREKMQPGDVVFLAPQDRPDQVKHVILYCSTDTFLEAPQTGQKVRFLRHKIDYVEENGFFKYFDRKNLFYPYYCSLAPQA